MNEAIITVENLGKRYSIRHERERYTALRDVLAEKAKGLFRRQRAKRKEQSGANGPTSGSSPLPLSSLPSARASTEEFWALKGVSFEVKRGEVLGIIGRNGAGKTTLLKILSRITEPTEGRVRIKGRVASLLEVGTGFHPELTGRENIYLNGAILGMTKAEIKKKFDEIVAFAETEKFLDTPVKRYSSGMYVRLAFAVAAHLEPEILIVDEVLAVGDAEFQKKCLGKMESVAKSEGRTIFFVSHNMEAIRVLCSKAIQLESGQIYETGDVQKVVRSYLRVAGSPALGHASDTLLGPDLRLDALSFDPPRPLSGDSLTFSLQITSRAKVQLRELALLIFSEFGARIAILDFRQAGIANISLEKNSLRIEGRIKSVPLVEGIYRVGLYVATNNYSQNFLDLAQFPVVSRHLDSDIVKYAPAHRGFIELDFDVSQCEWNDKMKPDEVATAT